jgi:uncharacterized repeat protein (TIGR03943 family)
LIDSKNQSILRVAVPEKNIDSYDICEEDKMKKNNLFIIQFIVMFLLISFSNPTVTVQKMNIDSKAEGIEEESPKGIIYWQKLLYNAKDPSEYLGKPVEILGFVYRHEEDPENIFFVGRLLLDCCYDDALPQGLPVLLEDNAKWENDQWILVKGKWDRIKVGDKERNVILPETIEKAEIPDDPYIYSE